MERMNIDEFKKEFRLVNDGDSWGAHYDAWFGVCEILYFKEESIPFSWQFKKGGRLIDKLNYWYSIFINVDSKDLLKIGAFLERYHSLLKYYEKDY